MGYARPFELEASALIERVEPVRAEADKLLGLELLRFLSALAVLLFHYRHFAAIAGMPPVARSAVPFHALLWPLYEYGQYGVQIFWGISGYIFFWKYGAAIHSGEVRPGNFFWLRFSRLYPLHFVTLLAVGAMAADYRAMTGGDLVFAANDPGAFALQLMFATQWGWEQPFTFNGPVWSVSAEVLVYAGFFLVARRFAPTARLCLMATVALLLLQVIGLGLVPIGCATFFFAGGLAALSPASARGPATLGLAALLLICAGTGSLGDRDKLPTILILAVPCLLIMIARGWPLLDRWGRAVQFAGNLTYSTYLLHFPLQLMLAIFVAASGIMPPLTSAWFLAAYLGVTLGAAALSYRWFELPAQNWIRLRTVKRNA